MMGNPISQPVQREDGPRVLSTAQMIMIVRIFPCLEWTQWLYFSAVGLQLAGRLVLSILLGNMMEYDRQLFHGDVGWIATKNPQSCPQYPSIWCRYIDDEAGASPTRKMPVRITLPVCSQPNFTRFIDFGSQCHRQEVSLSQTDVGGFHGWHQSFRPKFCQSCVFWLLDLALHEKPLLVMWFTCNNFGHLQRIKRHFLPVIKRISQPPLLMLRKDPASTGRCTPKSPSPHFGYLKVPPWLVCHRLWQHRPMVRGQHFLVKVSCVFPPPQTGTMSKESSQRSDVGRFSTIEDGVLVLKFFGLFGLFGFDPYHSWFLEVNSTSPIFFLFCFAQRPTRKWMCLTIMGKPQIDDHHFHI